MTTHETEGADGSRSATFWGAVVLAWAMIAYGVHGLVDDGVDLVGFGQWFVGLAVLHDAFVAPLAFAVAWGVGRFLPRWAVIPVRLGLASSALVTMYAWPFARGYGRSPSNPSALPLDYRRNLLVTLVVIWVVVAACIVVAIARPRANHEGGPVT